MVDVVTKIGTYSIPNDFGSSVAARTRQSKIQLMDKHSWVTSGILYLGAYSRNNPPRCDEVSSGFMATKDSCGGIRDLRCGISIFIIPQWLVWNWEFFLSSGQVLKAIRQLPPVRLVQNTPPGVPSSRGEDVNRRIFRPRVGL